MKVWVHGQHEGGDWWALPRLRFYLNKEEAEAALIRFWAPSPVPKWSKVLELEEVRSEAELVR